MPDSGTAPTPVPPQDATRLTEELYAKVQASLPKDDTEYDLAKQGLIEELPWDFSVDGPPGEPAAWDLAPYRFLTVLGPEPKTVNPSLWQNARHNMNVGLYEVVPDAVYQVRGMDISNITFMESPDQASQEIAVLDPLISEECAAAALALYRKHRNRQGQEPRTVKAVIFSHSHTDHYGGVRGLFDGGAPDPADGVAVIAPDGFLEHAVSENVYAGNAMSRRATFMYGSLLPKSANHQVDAGLGKTMSSGTTGLLAPTRTVVQSSTGSDTDIVAGQVVTFAGIRFQFQLTPGTEAPAEMNFYLPDHHSLCMAENATPTLHNLYSLRGAQVRDAKAWSNYLNEAVDLFGAEATSLFASHFWPRWKTSEEADEIVGFLTKQADLYRFLHDQTLRLANHGRTITEIAEDLDDSLPESLSGEWFNRGYYGTTNHDIKAVYQRYLGWFDGNAAHLHGLPPEKAGPRYVEAIGGADKVVALARSAYDNATSAEDYRWAAELLSHAVFADPADTAARQLEADVLEQLGYQAESGPWRNFYIAGAQELRDRPVSGEPAGLPAPEIITDDVIAAMPQDMVFDYLGIRLNGIEAADHPLTVNLTLTDPLAGDPARCTVQLRNGVLVYSTPDTPPTTADAAYTLTRTGLNQLALAADVPAEVSALVDSGDLTVDSGTIDPVTTLAGLLDTFDFWFALTTP
ncbi:alkyl/aryl-sulfatase [Streptomyces sp. NPDC051567]|uniref:alkyl/aryl-sulfatase n=1 Tax=Streptomyces sp. NPDC051567 TaxID=3365660 RepID=UPI0037B06043